jgi:NMT1-like family
VTIVPLDPDDVAASLRSHPVDVIFGAGPVTSKFFTDAIAAATRGGNDPHFLPITASEAIAKRLPVYEATELKKGVFGGHSPLPDDDVETIGYSHYIVAQQGLQEAVVSDLTRLIFSVRERLAAEFPAVRQIQKPDTDKDAVVLAHPGAAAFIDDHLQSFFDKYSDFIYLGLMLLSGLGSGAAWLTSYSRADDQIRKLRPVEALLDLAKSARAIETIDALDAARDEIDEILRTTMSQVERKELDVAVLFPLSVALNQAQAAIGARRADLVARPPAPAPAQVTPLRVASGE